MDENDFIEKMALAQAMVLKNHHQTTQADEPGREDVLEGVRIETAMRLFVQAMKTRFTTDKGYRGDPPTYISEKNHDGMLHDAKVIAPMCWKLARVFADSLPDDD